MLASVFVNPISDMPFEVSHDSNCDTRRTFRITIQVESDRPLLSVSPFSASNLLIGTSYDAGAPASY